MSSDLELSNDDEGRWYERHPDTLDPVVHAAFQSKRDAIEFVYELIDKSSSEFEREGDRWLQSTCDDFQEEIEVVEVPYFLKTRQDLQNFEEGSFEENFVSSSSSSISN